jgi:hypothetical protein
MNVFRRVIDFFTLGSDHPVRRLVAYYLVLAAVVAPLMYFFPAVDHAIGGAELDEGTSDGGVLVDGLQTANEYVVSPRLELTLNTVIILLGVLVLMLPVCWVYMSTRYKRGHDQQVAQILILLPLAVAGIVIVVQNSLALAFSLAGVVAAVRFRTTLRDSRDLVFIFLAITVGFAAGVQTLIVAAIVSFVLNWVLIFIWRYDFGRSVFQPTASSQWSEPLSQLAEPQVGARVPDRDLVLALDQKQTLALADRFGRVQKILGPQGRKPRYNAVLSVSTEKITEAQSRVAEALDQAARRWRLDEVVTNTGKPSVLYYLVRIRPSTSPNDFLTAVRAKATDSITDADVQLAKPSKSDGEGKP